MRGRRASLSSAKTWTAPHPLQPIVILGARRTEAEGARAAERRRVARVERTGARPDCVPQRVTPAQADALCRRAGSLIRRRQRQASAAWRSISGGRGGDEPDVSVVVPRVPLEDPRPAIVAYLERAPVEPSHAHCRPAARPFRRSPVIAIGHKHVPRAGRFPPHRQDRYLGAEASGRAAVPAEYHGVAPAVRRDRLAHHMIRTSHVAACRAQTERGRSEESGSGK